MWSFLLVAAHAEPGSWLTAPLTERAGSVGGISFTISVPAPVEIKSRTGWERTTADHHTMVGVYAVPVAEGDVSARVAALRALSALKPRGVLAEEARPDGHVVYDASSLSRFITLPGPQIVQCMVTNTDAEGPDDARRKRFLEICDSLRVVPG